MRHPPIHLALASLVLFAGGCDPARTSLTFRAVDAVTGKPLAGVRAKGREESTDIVFGIEKREFALPRSGADGLVWAGDLHAHWHQSFWFDSPGYLRARASRFHSATLGRAVSVDLPPTDQRGFPTGPYGVIQNQIAEPHYGVIEIKMYPERQGD